jgi:hypothetical protein
MGKALPVRNLKAAIQTAGNGNTSANERLIEWMSWGPPKEGKENDGRTCYANHDGTKHIPVNHLPF